MESRLSKPPEKLAFLLSVIMDDHDLFRWFASLRNLAAADRKLEIGTLGRRMAESGGDAKIVDALFSLTLPGQFEIMFQAVSEFREERARKT